MAEMSSLIRLRLPMQVIGYVRPLPIYMARSCTSCAAKPSAVATASSVTSLWEASDNGGAGSVVLNGIGNGTVRIVKSSSEEENSSIGYNHDSVEIKDVRIIARRARRASRHRLYICQSASTNVSTKENKLLLSNFHGSLPEVGLVFSIH